MYSAYPEFLIPYFSDSIFHQPKFDLNQFKDIGSVTEAVWMVYDEEDSLVIPEMLSTLRDFSLKQENLTAQVAISDANMKIDSDAFINHIDSYLSSLSEVDLTKHLTTKVNRLLKEVKDLIRVIDQDDLEKAKRFIDNSKYLFKGAVGVRHVDFVGHKPK